MNSKYVVRRAHCGTFILGSIHMRISVAKLSYFFTICLFPSLIQAYITNLNRLNFSLPNRGYKLFFKLGLRPFILRRNALKVIFRPVPFPTSVIQSPVSFSESLFSSRRAKPAVFDQLSSTFLSLYLSLPFSLLMHVHIFNIRPFVCVFHSLTQLWCLCV